MNTKNLTKNEKIVAECIDMYGKLPQERLVWKLYDYGLYITPRTIREYLKSINDKYNKGLVDYMVISDKDGCWISTDPIQIRLYNNRKRANALSMLKSAYDSEKRLRRDVNFSFEDYCKEVANESI